MNKFDTSTIPRTNSTITIVSGYPFTATGPSGAITGSNSFFIGQGFIFSGASSGGYVSGSEYYVGSGSTSGTVYACAKRSDSYHNTFISGASGNAGAGAMIPIYPAGGMLWVGTSGNINARGAEVIGTGTGFSIFSNVPVGMFQFAVKDICASGTTANNLVACY